VPGIIYIPEEFFLIKRLYMPGISNLELTLRRRPDTRIARVNFTTTFTPTEIFAHAVYKAIVEIRSGGNCLNDFEDDCRILHVDTITLMASSNPVQTLVERNFSETLFFEEQLFHGKAIGSPQQREWIAIVKLIPHIFETVTAESIEVPGSWDNIR
jgi:hypothetical protein